MCRKQTTRVNFSELLPFIYLRSLRYFAECRRKKTLLTCLAALGLLRLDVFDLRFQQIIHTVSFRCLTFISPDLKRFQHETSTTLAATTNSSSHENTLFQRAHARFPLARGGYNNSRQCQSHFRSPTETPVSGLLLETNNKTIKLKCSAFDILHLATCGSKLRLSL